MPAGKRKAKHPLGFRDKTSKKRVNPPLGQGFFKKSLLNAPNGEWGSIYWSNYLGLPRGLRSLTRPDAKTGAHFAGFFARV